MSSISISTINAAAGVGPTMGSPGVYTQTVDLSQYIAGVSGTIVATFGEANKGTLNPSYYGDQPSFIGMNGTPDITLGFGIYSTLPQFNYGPALFSRVVGSGYSYASTALWYDPLNLTEVPFFGPLPAAYQPLQSPSSLTSASSGNFEALAIFYSVGPVNSSKQGYNLNLVSANLTEVQNVVGTVILDDFSYNPWANGVIDPPVPSIIPLGAALNAGTYTYYVTAFNNLGETLGVATSSLTIAATGTLQNISLSWDLQAPAQFYKVYRKSPADAAPYYLCSTTNNSFTDNDIIIENDADTIPTVPFPTTPFFSLQVFDLTVSSVIPQVTFTSLSLAQLTNQGGQQTELASVINNNNVVLSVVNASTPSNNSLSLYSTTGSLTQGSNGSAVTDSELVAAIQNLATPSIYPLDLVVDSGYTDPTIQNTILTLCQTRNDSMGVFSIPSNYQSTATQAANYRNNQLNISNRYGAIYTPDLMYYDQFNNIRVQVPPAGLVAAQYSYSDSVSAPWFDPAGLVRGIIPNVQLTQFYSDPDKTILDKNQINGILNFPGTGVAIFNDLTLQVETSALRYICVNRMIYYINKSLKPQLQFDLFDPNDSFTVTIIVDLITQLLDFIMAAQGIQQFSVVSNSSNNPPLVLDQGHRIVDMIITPTLPMRDLLLRADITAQGVSLSAG